MKNNLICNYCKEGYYRRPSMVEESKFCSRKCQGLGQSVERKGKVCYTVMTDDIKQKISKSKTGVSIWPNGRDNYWMKGSGNYNWKGDRVGYFALHHWINREKGSAEKCVVCENFGGSKGCHWANLSGKYKRDINDYISLCPKCHKAWDRGNLPINLFEWSQNLNNKKGGVFLRRQ